MPIVMPIGANIGEGTGMVGRQKPRIQGASWMRLNAGEQVRENSKTAGCKFESYPTCHEQSSESQRLAASHVSPRWTAELHARGAAGRCRLVGAVAIRPRTRPWRGEGSLRPGGAGCRKGRGRVGLR